MNILLIDPHSYITEDLKNALVNLYGNSSIDELRFFFKGKDIYDLPEFETLFEKEIVGKTYDFAISTNFYPVLARLCNEHKIKYIAWTYDTPMNVLPCDEMKYETNFIFLFDRMEVAKYEKLGYQRFYHMPLGVNTKRLDLIRPDKQYGGDVAFLGKLYRSQLPYIKQGLASEMVGYIDKLVEVQKGIIDSYVVDDLISDTIIGEMNREYAVSGINLTINKEQLSYAIAEYVTYLDRVSLLEIMGRHVDTHLYTYDIGDLERSLLPDVKIHGPLDYKTQMPSLFKTAKINLSSSLRSARSAMSLRALDVLGCGGFLLSNAQPELQEHFEDKKEVVLYRDFGEAVELAEYYLKHDDERDKIAAAGYERVKRDFRYEDKLREMLKIAGIGD